MEERQATRIAMYACLRKRPLTEEEAQGEAEQLNLYFYCCPFSKGGFYHWHLTQGRNSRPWSKIYRAAETLGCMGPPPEELPDRVL